MPRVYFYGDQLHMVTHAQPCMRMYMCYCVYVCLILCMCVCFNQSNLFLSLSLSHTHTHTHTHKSSHCPLQSVGGDMFEMCVDALAPRGTLIVIGMMSAYASGWPPSSSARGLPERLLWKSATVSGFFLLRHAPLWGCAACRRAAGAVCCECR
jgi:hypothetical protein